MSHRHSDTSRCPTRLLDDTPVSEDSFAGPHKRIAQALATIIESGEAGGKTIGLEGAWGSGKSTIINLTSGLLQKTEHISLFRFDAWAHQGDPLRRTFLESLINHFKSEPVWIPREKQHKWEQRLLELAKRRRRTETHTTSKPTFFGKWVAVATLFVPLGIALFNNGLDQGIKIIWDPSRPLAWKIPLGLLFSFAPLSVLLIARRRARKRGEPFDWSLSKADTDTLVIEETTETPQPTSIEFEQSFGELMTDVLASKTDRLVVLILDNLDRVGVDDARSIWATLQTFLQHRENRQGWYQRVSIIVPYDRVGLRQLWANQSEVNGADVPDSFLDKSFQSRFEVPPLVLSNWKTYLAGLIGEALPNHTSEAEQQTIYRAFSLCRVDATGSPTPRELRLFVNQIGTIHRQWSEQPSHDDFPMGHIAYYVSLRRRRDYNETAFRQQLLATTLAKQKEITALFPTTPDLRSTLAGLLFNVRPALGRQLLLGDPIYNALTKPDPDELKTLERDHEDGFWVVLEEVTSTRLPDSDAAVLGMIAECLDKSGILKEQKRHEVVEIKRKLQEVVSRISIWPAANDPGFDGIRAICRVLSTSAISEHIVSGVRTRLSQQQTDLPPTELANMVTGLIETCKDINQLGHGEVLNEPFLIPVTGEGWLDLCPHIFGLEEKWRSLVKPSASFGDICSALSAAAEAGKFGDDQYLKIIPSTCYYFDDRDWSPLAQSIERRLRPGTASPTTEVDMLLRTLYNLHGNRCPEAHTVLESLAKGGQLMHYLQLAQAAGDTTCKATCIVAFLENRPDASQYPTGIGQFAAGQRTLATLLSGDDGDLASEILAFLRVIKRTELLFEVTEARQSFDPLIIGCLRIAADADWSTELFTPEVILNWWDRLYQHLDEDESSARFARLIERLSETQDFIPSIQAHQFAQKNAGLYLAICQASPNKTFHDWCSRGLNNLDTASWKYALASCDEVLELALTLLELGASPRLKHHFQDALVEFATEVARGESYEVIGQLQPHRQQFFDLLEGPRRANLQRLLLDVAEATDGNCADAFFELFGQEIARPEEIRRKQEIVLKLFSGLIKARRVGGLLWLRDVLATTPRLLDDFDSSSSRDFRGRIEEELGKANETDEAHKAIEAIAATLKIKRLADSSTGESEAAKSS